MQLPRLPSLSALAVLLQTICASSTPAQQPFFIHVPGASGSMPSYAQAVSADGRIVYGHTYLTGDKTYSWRWTRETGTRRLELGWQGVFVSDASDDGSVVVGGVQQAYGQPRYPYRWTEQGGLQILDTAPNSQATDVSADGSAAVVVSDTGSLLWDAAKGTRPLAALFASGISPDGKTVFGRDTNYRAFRWTESTGSVELGPTPANVTGTLARFSMPDGSVIGTIQHDIHPIGFPFHSEAARWTEANGWSGLGDLSGGRTWSDPIGVSRDGSVILGNSSKQPDGTVFSWNGKAEPFIWDAVHGMRALADVLTNDYGLSLAGWNLPGWAGWRASDLSADGRTIVGSALPFINAQRAWVAYLGPAPDKGTWNVDSNGSWPLAGNWTGVVPNAAGAEVTFGGATTAPRTVTLDVPITVGRIDFDNANAYTIAGASPLTLEASSMIHTEINVVAGNHTIGAPLKLADNTTINVIPGTSNLSITGSFNSTGKTITKTGAGAVTLNNLRAAELKLSGGTVAIAPIASAPELSTSVLSTLSIAGDAAPTATLDLNNNAAIIDHTATSPVTTVRQQILAGRSGSGLGKTWTGPGITSSAVAAANVAEPESHSVGYAENAALPLGPYTTFRGQPVDDTSLLIAFTRTGDANLDGIVNDDDVTIVGATYAPRVPQPHWALGDFDYNGFVDDDDVTLLGVFYDPSATPLNPPAEPGAREALATDVAAVPEPATRGLAGAGVLALLMMACRRGARLRANIARLTAGER